MNRLQNIFSILLQRIKPSLQKQKNLLFFLVIPLLVLSLGTVQETFGRLSQVQTVTDSATAAKFDLTITTPKEFWSEQGENFFEYYFLSDTDIQGFYFQVENNGEADLLCRPYINNDITYRIYVDEEECTEFIVSAKETVNFWLIISPNGLDTNITYAELSIDTWQIEGRGSQ